MTEAESEARRAAIVAHFASPAVVERVYHMENISAPQPAADGDDAAAEPSMAQRVRAELNILNDDEWYAYCMSVPELVASARAALAEART